jgi:hypothetical protein
MEYIKYLFIVMGMLLLTGCYESKGGSDGGGATPDCYLPSIGCGDENGRVRSTVSKICDCINDNTSRITLDLTCQTGPTCDITISQKQQLAKAGYHWYCVCQESLVVKTCYETEPCKFEKGEVESNRTISD